MRKYCDELTIRYVVKQQYSVSVVFVVIVIHNDHND